ncbi:MAG: EamA family transporter [Burkholderia sp.]|nr:EamA family transporter [Burkholderia sp.]
MAKANPGFILAITAAILWGISGVCAQFVFQEKRINIEWMVTVRLLVAGVSLLMYSASPPTANIWHIWRSRRSAFDLLVFAVFGMLAVQYTYFAAIKHSNAATGTVLQYLGPVFIALYFSFIGKRLPSRLECAALFFACLGTLLLVTHGDLGSMKISGLALFWGVSSAIALAFYTIHPVRLLRENDAANVVGWSMVVGGLGLSLLSKPWNIPGVWDMQTISAAGFIIVFGTLLSFYAYMAAVKRIGPQKTSLLACAEPLAATLVGVLWLNIPFALADWIGSLCILATLFILSGK